MPASSRLLLSSRCSPSRSRRAPSSRSARPSAKRRRRPCASSRCRAAASAGGGGPGRCRPSSSSRARAMRRSVSAARRAASACAASSSRSRCAQLLHSCTSTAWAEPATPAVGAGPAAAAASLACFAAAISASSVPRLSVRPATRPSKLRRSAPIHGFDRATGLLSCGGADTGAPLNPRICSCRVLWVIISSSTCRCKCAASLPCEALTSCQASAGACSWKLSFSLTPGSTSSWHEYLCRGECKCDAPSL
mmetsp:Transcript_107310/g.346282  ORF Transcript_107310/g.346282 Transcript_107310/m.346282 type:complete len:250 (+) Transcript_107310:1097-1846(+)